MFAFITALATLVIAIVALCQVRTATRAAKAAEAAANEANATRFADNRPALVIMRCEKSVPDPNYPGPKMRTETELGLRIANCGKGPASVTNLGFSLGETEYGREEGEPLPPEHHYYLPPAPDFVLPIPDIRFHEFARKCLGSIRARNAFHQLFQQRGEQPPNGNGPKRLTIEGWIEYADIFGTLHGQRFTFRQTGEDRPRYEVVPGVYYQPGREVKQTDAGVGQEAQDEQER